MCMLALNAELVGVAWDIHTYMYIHVYVNLYMCVCPDVHAGSER